jgi:hypothetical protein
MKTCFKCGIPKQMDDFYIHRAMADGHLGKCKVCTKFDACAHRDANLGKIQEYDRQRGKLPHRKAKCREYSQAHPEVVRRIRKRWADKHPEKVLLAHQRYAERYPERYAAHIVVGNAVRDGRLVKQPCEVCGALKVEAHHDDYSKPLDVRWLCNSHHKIADAERRLRDGQ